MCDLLLSSIATLASLGFLNYFLEIAFGGYAIIQIILFSLLCSAFGFLWCRTYKGVIRHSTITEAGRIVLASLGKVAFVIPLVATMMSGVPLKGVLFGGLLDLFLTFSGMILFRVLLILSYHLMISNIS